MTTEEILDSLESFHQASLCRGLAFSHQQEELEAQWDDILIQRTEKLLATLLRRPPTNEELNRVLNPPLPEPPYEA